MPGVYSGGDFDLAGFCVGIVEKDNVIDGSSVKSGDSVIALASSGPHSNGYSLIRKIIEVSGVDLRSECGYQTLADALISPTRIYVKNLLELSQHMPPKAIAHITGGGLLENIPRVLPGHCAAELNLSSWALPPVFDWLQKAGNVAQEEMLRTFNCGVGMVLIVESELQQACLDKLTGLGEQAWTIGRIVENNGDSIVLSQ